MSETLDLHITAVAGDYLQAEPQRFELDGGFEIAGLAWGKYDPDSAPILAMHGWLDNAASFSRIAPLLAARGFYILAIDLPGHGHSSHKPAFGSYNIWDDLVIIHSLLEQLGWERYHLLGHSRGAMISTLAASAMPTKVATLQTIDGLIPEMASADETPKQLHKHIKEYLRAGRKRLPVYASIDDAITARCKATGMTREAARPIVERGVIFVEAPSKELADDAASIKGSYHWRSDIRLTGASALKLTEEHCTAVLKGITMPFQMIMAEGGMGQWATFNDYVRQFPLLNIIKMAGGHHLHLDEPAADVAEKLADFLTRH